MAIVHPSSHPVMATTVSAADKLEEVLRAVRDVEAKADTKLSEKLKMNCMYNPQKQYPHLTSAWLNLVRLHAPYVLES